MSQANHQKKSLAADAAERVVFALQDRHPTIIRAIESAKERVGLSMFRCNDFKIMDKLAEALTRNVKVDLLLTQRAKGWEKRIRGLGLYLESMGARVHRYALPAVKYHAKYVVVDRSLAIVATLNLTAKCFEETADFLVLTRDTGVISGLLTLFERDVESPGAALPAGLTDRLIIGPDTARARFRELILSARRSIRLVDHRVTDPDMLELLRSREAQGLKVKVYGQGALQGLRSHGKVMLIDDGKAVLGSMSLSPPSLGARREVAVITEDPGCVEQVRQCLKKGRASALPEKAEEAPGKDEEEEEEEEENREDS